MDKYLIEACMEALKKLNLSGDLENMDEELMSDIVESFIRTGYLQVIPFNQRSIIYYHDDSRSLYIYADNLREVEADIIASLNKTA